MKRPYDPRHHGLQEPDKVVTKTEFISLNEFQYGGTRRVPLTTILNIWNKITKDLEGQDIRITIGPDVIFTTSYPVGTTLSYTYERDNVDYEKQKEYFDKTVNTYLEELKAYEEHEVVRKKAPVNLDDKIAKTERRLANLKAAKAGEPIPFPD